jgi:pantetheine-phosphate adenylyltransferase
MKIGLYTGTFDPMTKGHLDIIQRAAQLFDKLYVGIFKNDRKSPLFTAAERKTLFETLLKDTTNVELLVHESDLTVNVAQQLGVTALVRSVRNAKDLAYESEMVYFNHQMTGIETVLLVAKPDLQYINSTRMKELAHFGVDLSEWLPAEVVAAMEKKIGQK